MGEVPIIVPKDSFKSYILLNVIRQQVEDADIHIGEEYYISYEGLPIKVDRKTLSRIAALVDTFPPNCNILSANPINELVGIKYPQVVKLNEYTGLWYKI